MAELPRYKSSGLQVAVPEGQFRDVSAPMDALSKGMNQMTSFFMQSAQEQAVVEGEKYGAENAPTVDQIKLMVSSGETIKPVGDTFTIFGQSAQKASSEIVATRIGYAASAELDKIKASIEDGGSSSKAGLDKFNAAIKGYSSALGAYDPVAGKKLEAELAYKSNQLYLAASKKAASSISEATANEIEQILVTDRSSIPGIIQSGDSLITDKDGNSITLTLAQKKAIALDRTMKLASKIGKPAFVKTTVDAFNKEWDTQSKAIVSIWAADPAKSRQRINQVRLGKADDPAMQSILDSLTPDDRKQIFTESINVFNAQTNLERTFEAQTKSENAAKLKVSTSSFYKALNAGDTAAAKDVWNSINELDPNQANKLKKHFATTITKDDVDVVRRLTVEEIGGTLTMDIVLEQLQNENITPKTALAIQRRLEQDESEDMKRAMQYLRDAKSIGYNTNNRDLANRKIGTIRQDLLQARAQDPTIDPLEFVKSAVESTGKKINNSYENEVTDDLLKFATINGVQVTDGRYLLKNIDAAIVAAKNATSDADELERLIRLALGIAFLREQKYTGIK
jgi:hypothetical protein